MDGDLARRDDCSPFVAQAADVVRLRFVRGDEAAGDGAAEEFAPQFTHQHFGENETIFGYTGVRVVVSYAAASLEQSVEVHFDSRVDTSHDVPRRPFSADDIGRLIQSQLPEDVKLCRNSAEFSARLDKQRHFAAFGSVASSYVVGEEGQQRRFEVRVVDGATDAFAVFLARLQSIALWYIDAAQYTEPHDAAWKHYLLYQVAATAGEKPSYLVAGYAAVYRYYAYPDKLRPRIAQMLVLPPYRRCGHGVRLMQALYDDLNEPRVVDITVEEPSDECEKLRDFVDARNCLQLPSFCREKLLAGFSGEMKLEANDQLKLCQAQIRRVYEICRLSYIKAGDDKELRRFRLDVKNRLNKPHRKTKKDRERLERLSPADVVHLAMTAPDDAQRLNALQHDYERLERAYRVVIGRLHAYASDSTPNGAVVL